MPNINQRRRLGFYGGLDISSGGAGIGGGQGFMTSFPRLSKCSFERENAYWARMWHVDIEEHVLRNNMNLLWGDSKPYLSARLLVY